MAAIFGPVCRELDLPVVRSLASNRRSGQQEGEAPLPRPPPLSVYRLPASYLMYHALRCEGMVSPPGVGSGTLPIRLLWM